MIATLAIFPAINATLNGASAVLLLVGRRFIGRRDVVAHKRTMLAAFCTSSLFLACYLYYHFSLYYRLHVAPMHFAGQGWSRPVYFSILLSHTILAMVVVPMVLITLARGLKARYALHRKIARWTYPIWLYVSVTGVVIYVMLYHLFRA